MRNLCMTLITVLLITGCGKQKETEIEVKEITIKEVYQTDRDLTDNVDSPAFWKKDSTQLLMATAKETHKILVYDAVTGNHIKDLGKEGSGELEFKRPNGIAVINDYLLVVERDNKRVQIISLPDFEFIGFVTDSLLTNPYGLSIVKNQEDKFRLYVTDNYLTKTEEIPADSLLGNRIHIYDLNIKNKKLDYKLTRYAGETSGRGVLSIVESLYLDAENDNLMVAEEDETQSSIKIYDSEGNFKDMVLGLGLFKYQVEGIALYKKENAEGFWIVTDQSHEKNRFMIFDRKTFDYKGAFIGENTLNTDGIWLTQKSFGNFEEGAFFAIHDDGNISAFDLAEILKNLKL